MNRICVYCGSRTSSQPNFGESADQLGHEIAKRTWGVVFGGGKIGMMGRVAEAALAQNGEVIGIIPTALKVKEVAHTGLSELIETPDMHTRKAKMEELSHAFVILPGGFGTLDEFFEILTWRQLGFHNKPIIVVDIDWYFSGLEQYIQRAVDEDYVRESNLRLFEWVSTVEEAMTFLDGYFQKNTE